jgi:hypothetical protein
MKPIKNGKYGSCKGLIGVGEIFPISGVPNAQGLIPK